METEYIVVSYSKIVSRNDFSFKSRAYEFGYFLFFPISAYVENLIENFVRVFLSYLFKLNYAEKGNVF